MLFGIRMIPYGSRYLAEAIVALRRIQALLLLNDFNKSIRAPADPDLAILFSDATLTWLNTPSLNSEDVDEQQQQPVQFLLRNITIKIQKVKLLLLNDFNR